MGVGTSPSPTGTISDKAIYISQGIIKPYYAYKEIKDLKTIEVNRTILIKSMTLENIRDYLKVEELIREIYISINKESRASK